MAENLNTEELARQVDQLSESFGSLNRSMNPAMAANAEAAKIQKQLNEQFAQLKKELGKATISFAATAASADRSAGKYGDSIEKIVGAAGSMVAMKMPMMALAKGVNLVVGIFGSMATAALKQNDMLLKTYRDLSQFGANNSNNFREMLDNLHRAGFNVENAEQFTAALKKVGPELALFAGNAGAGAERLTKVFGTNLDDNQRSLAKYGYTIEEAMNYTASYVAQQSKTGAARTKTDQQLNAGAMEYMKTLAELSTLTGAQRDDIDKNRRAQEADIRYQMALRKLELSGSEEDRETAKRIRFQTDTYYAIGAKEAAEGWKSVVANGGKVNDIVSARFQQMVGNEGIGAAWANVHKRGDMALEMTDTLQFLGGRVKNSMTNLDGVLNSGVDNFNQVYDAQSGYALMMAGESQNRAKLVETFAKLNNKETDDRLKITTEREIAERKLTNVVEDMTFAIGNKVIPALTSLTKLVYALAWPLAKTVKFLGGGDFTKEVGSANDIMYDSVPEQKKYLALEKEIAAVEKERQKYAEGTVEAKKEDEKLEKLRSEKRAVARSLVREDENYKMRGGSRDSMLNKSMQNRIYRDAGATTPSTANTTEAQSQSAGNSGDPTQYINFAGNSGGLEAFKRLDPDFAGKVLAAAEQYYTTSGGKKLQVNSSFRSYEEQMRMYQQYIANGQQGTPVASPDNSRHVRGRAVDIQNYNDSDALRALGQQGLFNGIKNDPVHFQGAYNGAIFKGPKSGYWARLHGTEGVFNEKQMSTLTNSLTRHTIPGGGGMGSISADMSDLFKAILDKISELVDLQHTNNRTSEEHLKHAKTN